MDSDNIIATTKQTYYLNLLKFKRNYVGRPSYHAMVFNDLIDLIYCIFFLAVPRLYFCCYSINDELLLNIFWKKVSLYILLIEKLKQKNVPTPGLK